MLLNSRCLSNIGMQIRQMSTALAEIEIMNVVFAVNGCERRLHHRITRYRRRGRRYFCIYCLMVAFHQRDSYI